MKRFIFFILLLLMPGIVTAAGSTNTYVFVKKRAYNLTFKHSISMLKEDLGKTNAGESRLVADMTMTILLFKPKVSDKKVTFKAKITALKLDYDEKNHVSKKEAKANYVLKKEELGKIKEFELTLNNKGVVSLKNFGGKSFQKQVINNKAYKQFDIFGKEYFSSKKFTAVLSQCLLDPKFGTPKKLKKNVRDRFTPKVELPAHFIKMCATFAEWWQLKDLIGGLQGYSGAEFGGAAEDAKTKAKTITVSDTCSNTFVDQWGMWTVNGKYEMKTIAHGTWEMKSGEVNMHIVEKVTDTLSGVGNGQFVLDFKISVDFEPNPEKSDGYKIK